MRRSPDVAGQRLEHHPDIFSLEGFVESGVEGIEGLVKRLSERDWQFRKGQGQDISLIYSKWIKRYPIHYFSVPVLLPLGTFFAFAFTIAPQNKLYAVSGPIVFSIMVNTLPYIAQWVGSDRQIRRISLFATMPVSPIAYGFGVALSVVLRGLISIGIILVVTTWLFGLSITLSWLALIPTLLISFAAGVLLGLLIAWSTYDTRALFSVAQFSTFTLGLFSPVFYPISVLPLPLRIVASAVPTTYARELVRDSLTGNVGDYLNGLWPMLGQCRYPRGAREG